MILHSDGRIEGTPSEIAEYERLKRPSEPKTGPYQCAGDESAEQKAKELERIRNIPATMVRTDSKKHPGAGTICGNIEDFFKLNPL